MSRIPVNGVYADGAGNIVVNGNATFYEYKAADPSNPDTIATIYAAQSGGSAIATGVITTDSNGAYLAWIDDGDYGGGSIFTLILSKSTHTDVPFHFIIAGLSFKDAVETLTNKTLTTPQINDTSEDHQYIFAVNELSADRTITLPLLTANATFAFINFAQAWTALQTFNQGNIRFGDTSDDHYYTLGVSELSANRTITLPLLTGNDTFVFLSFAATLENKTYNDPIVTGNFSGNAFLDEDDMSSDSATKAASQQSIKKYVDDNKINLGTEQASTSGTAIDFTSIPAGTKKITIMFAGVSLDGTEELLIQIGDSGGVETSGYLSAAREGGTTTGSTAGFILVSTGVAAEAWNGLVTLTLENSANFTWVSGSNLGRTPTASANTGGGSKSLSAELDRVRITTTGTPDDFDAGAINIQYE